MHTSPTHSSDASATAVAPPSSRRVLVVDDDDDMRQMITTLLRRARFEVTTACNGSEAITSLRQSRPGLMVMDIMMPEKDGLETLLELRRAGVSIPVIAISGGGLMSHHDALRTARSFGAAAVLAKPFSPRELLACITTLVGETP